jgi:hypothetical protein
MGLLDDITASRNRPGPACSVALFAAGLGPKDRADLTAALADEKIEGAQIWRAIRDRGFTSQQNTVSRHRRGDCACRTERRLSVAR